MLTRAGLPNVAPASAEKATWTRGGSCAPVYQATATLSPLAPAEAALTGQAKGYFTSTNHRACESSLRRARITSRPVLGLAGIGQIRDGVGGGNGPPGTYPLFPQGVSHKPEN